MFLPEAASFFCKKTLLHGNGIDIRAADFADFWYEKISDDIGIPVRKKAKAPIGFLVQSESDDASGAAVQKKPK